MNPSCESSVGRWKFFGAWQIRLAQSLCVNNKFGRDQRMALTVNDAFKEFNKNIVNIDIEKTKQARSSRDWLVEQLKTLPSKIDEFPISTKSITEKSCN